MHVSGWLLLARWRSRSTMLSAWAYACKNACALAYAWQNACAWACAWLRQCTNAQCTNASCLCINAQCTNASWRAAQECSQPEFDRQCPVHRMHFLFLPAQQAVRNLASARLIRKGCTFGASFAKLGTRKNTFGLVSTGNYCSAIDKFIFLEYIRTGDSCLIQFHIVIGRALLTCETYNNGIVWIQCL